MEKQVCSLKLAKKLKKLRVKQESYFLYIFDNGEWEIENEYIWEKIEGEWGDAREIKDLERYSAFTVAELGEKLPWCLRLANDNYYEIEYWCVGKWGINYKNRFDGVTTLLKESIFSKHEANARAKMLVYLIENKLLKIKKKK